MSHLREVLFMALLLLVALALAEEGRGKLGFGSISSDVNVASGARVASSLGLGLAAKSSGGALSTPNYDADVKEGLERDILMQDSISRRHVPPTSMTFCIKVSFRSSNAAHYDFRGLQENGASVTQDDSQLSHGSVDKHVKKASMVELTFTSSDDNATVATQICNSVTGGETQLTIRSTGFHQFPDCLASSSLTFIGASGMVTFTWSVFPTSLGRFWCNTCRFRYDTSGASTPVPLTPAAQAADGFNEDGTLNWDEIFANLPNIYDINLSASSLKAQLPTELPSTMISFAIGGVTYDSSDPTDGLTGTIPSTLLSNIGAASTESTTITLDFSTTRITGTIPSDLFSSFSGKQVGGISFTMTNSGLQTTLTSALFLPLSSANLGYLVLNLQRTPGLTGSLPTSMFPNNMFASADASLTLFLLLCGLTGPIPEDFLAAIPDNSFVSVDLAYNQISGPLPTQIFTRGNMPSYLMINLGHNAIGGELTSFFSSAWTRNTTAVNVFFLLNDNQLTGTIPETLLFGFYESKKRESDDEIDIEDQSHQNAESSSSSRSTFKRSSDASSASIPVGIMSSGTFQLSLANNGLTGSVPSNLIYYSLDPSMTGSSTVNIDLSNNFLESEFPSDFFATVPASMTQTLTFAASNNSFTGSIPALCSTTTTPYVFTMALNKLSGSIPTSWESCALVEFTVDDNPQLAGSIPPNLFTSTGIYKFSAKNTSLTGDLPTVGSTLGVFDLSYTQLSFCDAPSVTSMSGYSGGSGSCSVESTIACSCPTNYQQCGGTDIACPAGPLEPIAPFVFMPPTASNTPPTSTPSNPPVALAPGGCTLATRPGPEFYCFDGRWYAPSVTTSTLTIPPGTGKVVVLGNLQSSSVVFGDLNSSVDVDGCANNLTTVSLQLTKAQIEQIGTGTVTRSLIVTSGSNCNNLNSVNLNTHVADQGCKKLKTTKQVSADGRTLNAIFSLQTSSCNNWWIILVAVMCSLVVIAVVVTVILVTCCDFCKQKARPFAGSDGRFMT